MHAYLAIALALAAPALAVTRDRFGYEREIDSAHNQHPKLLDYVLDDQQLAAQKNRGKLITRTKPDDVVASDNVILESKVLTLLSYPKKKVENKNGEDLVRTRRGYNLENVRVPARYPYLAVPQYNRFRRWG